MILSVTNDYTGSTTIVDGDLKVASDTALGNLRSVAGVGKLKPTTIVFDSTGAANARPVFYPKPTGNTFRSSRDFKLNTAGNIKVDDGKIVDLSGDFTVGSGPAEKKLFKKGKGTLVLSGDNSGASADIEVDAGTLKIASANGFFTRSLILDSSVGGNSSTLASEVSATFIGETKLGKGVGVDPTVRVEGAETTLTLGGKVGPIDNIKESALIKEGPGKLVLSNSGNDYKDGTVIKEGTISVSDPGNLGIPKVGLSAGLTFGGVRERGGTLEITGDGFIYNKVVTIGKQGKSVIEVAVNCTATFQAPINGGAAGKPDPLMKRGAGKLVLIPTGIFRNLYTAPTEIQEGILAVDKDANLGATKELTIKGGTLSWTATGTASRPIALGDKRKPGTISVEQGVTLTWSGKIQNTFRGTGTANGRLIKAGPGTLVLTFQEDRGGNTYTGGTQIEAGTLQISKLNHLGDPSGNIVDFKGGTLKSTEDLTFEENAISVAKGSTGAFDVPDGKTITVRSNINLDGTGSEAATLTKKGLGTLVLNGTLPDSAGTLSVTLERGKCIFRGRGSTFANPNVSGTLTINNGLTVTIDRGSAGNTFKQYVGKLEGSGTLELNTNPANSNDLSVREGTFSGVITGKGSLIKAKTNLSEGSDILELSGVNTYTGDTKIEGGTLKIARDNNLGAGGLILSSRAASGTLHVTGDANLGQRRVQLTNAKDGIFEIDTELTTGSQKITGTGSLLKKGAGTLILGDGNSYARGTTLEVGVLRISRDSCLGTLGSPLTLKGGTLELSPTGDEMVLGRPITLSPATLAARSKIKVVASKTATLSGIISGVHGLVVDGAGTLVLSGNNIYTGRTDLLAGSLKVSKDQNLGGAAATINFDGGTLIASQGFEMSRAMTIGAKKAIIQVDSGNLRMRGKISDLGRGTNAPLEKRGKGTLILDNSHNNYMGQTIIQDGTVQISEAQNLAGTNETLEFNGGATHSPTLKITEDINALYRPIALTSDGTIDVVSGKTLTVPDPSPSNWIISGRGKLIKTGEGRLVLAADNTYSGGTECTAGTLSISKDLNLGEINGRLELKGGELEATEDFTMSRRRINVSSGQGFVSVRVSRGKTLTITQQVTGAPGSTLRKLGEGKLTFTGGVVDGVDVDVKNGEIDGQIDNLGNVDKPSVVNTPEIDTVGEGQKKEIAGSIVGNGKFEKRGTGEVVLSGDNTFTGDLIITNGILSFSENINLGLGRSPIELNGGELLFTGRANLNMGRAIKPESDRPVEFVALNVKEKGVVLKASLEGDITKRRKLKKKGAGTLFIEGSNFVGTLIVEEGLFKGKGNLKKVEVEVESGAAARPGGSRGDLEVKSYLQKTGGELQIELFEAPKEANMLKAEESIQFEPGTKVSLIINQGGLFKKGDVFPFLEAGRSIMHWKDNLKLIEDHPLDFVIEPVDPKEASPKRLQIRITESKVIFRIPVEELKGRARSVAKYISRLNIQGLEDLESVEGVLVKLPRDQLSSALSELSPAQFGGSTLSLLQSGVRISSALIGPLSQQKQVDPTPSQTVWATPFGYYYDQKEKGEVLPFRDRTYGFAGGYQRAVLGSFLASVGLGYAYSDLSWLNNRGYGVLQSIYLGPSFGYKGTNGHLCLTLLGGMSFHDMTRRIEFGQADRVDRKAENRHISYDLSASLNGGLKFQIFEKAQKGLFVATEFKCDALNIFENGFEESGAGDVSLKVEKGYLAFLRPELKLKLMKEVNLPGLKISPQISVGFLRNIRLNRGEYRSKFASLKEDKLSFAVQGYRHLSNQLSFGAGFKLSHQENYALTFDYSANISYQLAIQEAKLQFSWKF